LARASSSIDKAAISKLAGELGFSDCRFTVAALPRKTGDQLRDYVAMGYHASMGWMAETLERRISPQAMWPGAKTAIVLAMNYGPKDNPLQTLQNKSNATISVYAQNRDYHELIKGRLKQIAQKIASANKCEVKVFVDTAPLMEKPLAQRAGIGWQGKHTNLVSRKFGSWLFLGTILTDAIFANDGSETDHCGNCTACLDICPTHAFPAPYQLDAARCISYLTIEHAGPIPREFRSAMGNRIYGCDDCLAICPWNKFAVATQEIKLAARPEMKSPLLWDLLELDDVAFRSRFSGSPVKRIGRSRFIRNVLIASGNSGESALAQKVIPLLRDESAVVRGAAIWAIAQLSEKAAFIELHNTHISNELDPDVRMEWQQAASEFEPGKHQ
jgi:epoxyqueuosine reductase